MGIGVGNGGDTSISAKSTTLGKWEHLVSFNSVAPANEFILCSTVAQGAEFYADDAIVCSAETTDELQQCETLIGVPPTSTAP